MHSNCFTFSKECKNFRVYEYREELSGDAPGGIQAATATHNWSSAAFQRLRNCQLARKCRIICIVLIDIKYSYSKNFFIIQSSTSKSVEFTDSVLFSDTHRCLSMSQAIREQTKIFLRSSFELDRSRLGSSTTIRLFLADANQTQVMFDRNDVYAMEHKFERKLCLIFMLISTYVWFQVEFYATGPWSNVLITWMG